MRTECKGRGCKSKVVARLCVPCGDDLRRGGHPDVSHDEAVAWCPTHQEVHLGCDADRPPYGMHGPGGAA